MDLALDEEDLRAGRKIRAETLVLWGANGLVERFFRPLECWAKFGDHIQGHNLPCGHFIPEEAPLPMLEAVATGQKSIDEGIADASVIIREYLQKQKDLEAKLGR